MPFCPVCGVATDCRTRSHADFEAADVYSCSSCVHRFTDPEPGAEWLARYYRQTYSSRRMQNFGLPYRELMKRRAFAQVRFIRTYLENSLGSVSTGFHGLRVCDIGCGIGALVAQFQSEGADAEGFDSDPSAIEFGRHLGNGTIYTRALGDTRTLPEHDLVCMSHVLEHLPDIRNSFQKATRRLKPGGHLFVEVPNTPPEPLAECLDMESHIHFFSTSSLSAFLEKSGFTTIACTRCGPPAWAPPERKQRPLLLRKCRRIVESMGHRMLWLMNRPDKVRTPYDGFFDRYYEMQDQRGLWIRCFAVKGGP